MNKITIGSLVFKKIKVLTIRSYSPITKVIRGISYNVNYEQMMKLINQYIPNQQAIVNIDYITESAEVLITVRG